MRAPHVDGNGPMVSLLERLGPTARTNEDGDQVAYTRLRDAA